MKVRLSMWTHGVQGPFKASKLFLYTTKTLFAYSQSIALCINHTLGQIKAVMPKCTSIILVFHTMCSKKKANFI